MKITKEHYIPTRCGWKEKTNYSIEIDGIRYYGCHTKEDAERAIARQKVTIYLKDL